MRDAILIVDEEQAVRRTLARALRVWGCHPLEAASSADALTSFDGERPAAVLLAINLPDGSSLEVLREIRRRQSDAVVIVLAARAGSDEVISALRSGASDFILKPINLEELEVRIRNSVEAKAPCKEGAPARRARAGRFGFEHIVGRSLVMQEMLRLARKVAESEVSSVLLQGESGTGKELVAKAIHFDSKHASHPFVAINCAALPPSLIESELFGHEKGAFTDAKARKEGLLELGNGGGTIFLDEIGELDINLQAKLLRVLEEGSFRRVGGLKDVNFSARVIAASNHDLKAESEAGRFRLDLYYRLAVIRIDIPRLSERGDDVLLLAQHFITSGFGSGSRNIRGLTPEAASAFRLYDWPGNVRELRNMVEHALILEDGDMISTRHLPRDIVPDAEHDPVRRARTRVVNGDASVSLPDDGISLDDVEASLLKQALARSGGNQTHAAELLGMTRDKFRYRMKKLKDSNQGRRAATATGSSH
jgi:two-component system response regulator AtoC